MTSRSIYNTLKAMALADKYMSMEGLYSYMKAHYQLIIVTCLSIAIKVDSPTIVVTSQELSELCRGEYTREDIESEEMCVLHALAWYVNPPTASQIANHILALVENFKGAQSEWDWAVLVDRVHRLIKASVLDLGLSTQMRPSTLALASILVSTESLRDHQCQQAVLRSILSVMNEFDFASPSEIDTVRTDLTFLQRSYNTSPSSFHQQPPQQAPIVQPANVLSASNSVFGSNSNALPNPSSQVAENIPSSLYCMGVNYCADANPSSQAPIQRRRKGTIDRTNNRADVKSSQPPRQRNRAGAIGPTMYRRADSFSSESSAESSRDTATQSSRTTQSSRSRTTQSSSESVGGLDSLDRGYSEQHYLPLKQLKKVEERRVRMSSLSFHSASSANIRAMSSLSFHSSSTTTILDPIPEFVEVDEYDDGEEEKSSGGVSALTHQSSPVRAASLRRQKPQYK